MPLPPISTKQGVLLDALIKKGVYCYGKAFAFICTQDEVPVRRLRQYCRRVYFLGYVPVCPKLSLPQFLDYEIAEERRNASQMSQLWLRRCRMVVVCGSEISGTMLAEISTAQRLKLICTTLDGLEKISGHDENRPS